MDSGAVSVVPIEYVAVVGRIVLLGIVALSGTFSIFLGWKMYRDGISSQTSLDASQGERWTIKLSAAGPGVFFALFGAWLLIQVTNQAVDIEIGGGAVEYLPESSDQSRVETPPLIRPAMLQVAERRREPRTVRRGRRICVLAPTRIHFLDGDLSPTAIRDAINTALPILQAHARGNLSPRDAARVNDSIDTLAESLNWTGEWEIRE